MDELDRRNRAIALFTLYGGLLSKTQREALSSHLCYDLSISEIAESARISARPHPMPSPRGWRGCRR